MKFIDVAEIKVKAGEGGVGMAHFRREKFVPFGGPDGGDGGEGGNVVLEGNEGLSTLLDFRYQRYHEAEDGGRGGTNNRTGRNGKETVLRIPCGTVIFDADSSEIIGEILHQGDRLTVAKGGRGGMGNSHFASSKNQAPTRILPPAPGERRSLRLELKMMADVGIIGSPNAGKSTIVTTISAARPKVADYPFTTLVPTLGVVSHKDAPPFVVADVPGLIAGAHEGKGLGHDFLRHIERTRVLVHMIDGSQGSVDAMIADFEGILNELKLYNAELLTRPRLTVLSKVDLAQDSEEPAVLEAMNGFCAYLTGKEIPYLIISAAQRQGIDIFLDKLVETLARARQQDA